MASGGDFKQYSRFGREYESGEKDLNRTIENNLKVFRPMIVRDLDYQVFLMYPHFSLDQKKELHRMGKAESNAEDVVERGLQMIAELRNCPTNYTDFLELLQDGDYREITKILKGEILPDNDEYRNHINFKLKFICQKVNSEQIVTKLLKRNVIGERDLQTVRNLQRDCSQVNAMAELMLIMLPRKTELWYPYFIEALLEMDSEVAEEVDHDLCEKLKQRRQKRDVGYMEDEAYLLKDYKPSVPVSSDVPTHIKDRIVGGPKQSKQKTVTVGSSCENLDRKIESGLIKKPQGAGQAIVVPGQDALTAAMLASAPPQEQKQMLGERLFKLIQRMQPEFAGKITGMLLAIDNSELLHMLGSHESLTAKVEEAVAVLQAHQQGWIQDFFPGGVKAQNDGFY